MRAPSNCASEAGSIELIALGFCAALVVLLAIPLCEVLFFDTPASPSATQAASIPATGAESRPARAK
jgi:hypothetical protein